MSATQTRMATDSTCWSCRARTHGEHFCPACGKIQPLPRGTDYFAFFGLPRKLRVDAAELEALRDPISRVEYLLAREGARKEGEHKQQAPPELLEEVFELNESLDELRGIRQGAGMSGRQIGDGAGEMAALRGKLLAAQKNFEEKLAEVDAELEGVAGQWDAVVDASPGPAGDGDDAARKKLMARMNEILNRRSYIRNLVAGVQKELAEA